MQEGQMVRPSPSVVGLQSTPEHSAQLNRGRRIGGARCVAASIAHVEIAEMNGLEGPALIRNLRYLRNYQEDERNFKKKPSISALSSH